MARKAISYLENNMGNDLFESRIISIKEAGFDEAWLQNAICENPQKIGLGDLQLVSKEKVISSGGRLDILLKDSSDEKMYEVEVQLGETDPSHIIRTIEYWDLISKRYKLRQHYGVLIAESITKRFFNVISLLSDSIPIIAIQCQIIEVDNRKSLVFNKILDAYEEPAEEEEEEERKDEGYWAKMSPRILGIAKKAFNETKEIYVNTTMEYNKWSIAIKKNGYNQLRFNKRSNDFVHIELKYGTNKAKIFKILEDSGVPVEEKYSQARFVVQIEWLEKNMDKIKEIALLNNEWWKTIE
jgi:hypothetical protein